MSKQRKLFDPSAPKKPIILPSQQKQKQEHLEMESQEPVLQITAAHELKEKYSLICKLEEKWRKSPKRQDFEARLCLFGHYRDIILKDYRLAIKYDLDSRQWKFVLYNLFSTFRSQFSEMAPTDLKKWAHFFDQVTGLYLEQIKLLKNGDHKFPVWISLYSHIGDIHRYQAQCLRKHSSWNTAREFYDKASLLSPGNGLLWNQLGIVARAQGLYLESALYYMRALCLKKPFASARESLLEIFHHLTEKADVDVLGDDSILVNFAAGKGQRIAEYSFAKLQIALFTKIGLDEFSRLKKNCIMELKKIGPVVNIQPYQIQIQWWISIALISFSNMYLVSVNPHYEQPAKDAIFDYGLEFIVDLVNICTAGDFNLIPLGEKSFLCLVLMWLASSSLSDSDISNILNRLWPRITARYQHILPREFQPPPNLTIETIFEKTLNLPEDRYFGSYIPLGNLNILKSTTIEPTICDEESELIDLKRDARFILLVVFMTQKYHQLALSTSSTNSPLKVDDDLMEEVNFAEFIFEEQVDEEEGEEQVDEEVEEEECVQQVEEQAIFFQQQQSFVSNLIEDTEASADVLELKSRMSALTSSLSKPAFQAGKTVLVLDTNCFVNDFVSLMRIMDSRKWKVVVPLAVITELQGLSQNAFINTGVIQASLEYLRRNVGKTFQLETSRGNLLSNFNNVAEQWDVAFTNADDVILNICRKHAEVCLVSFDINLRLKAATVGVPCANPKDFLI